MVLGNQSGFWHTAATVRDQARIRLAENRRVLLLAEVQLISFDVMVYIAVGMVFNALIASRADGLFGEVLDFRWRGG